MKARHVILVGCASALLITACGTGSDDQLPAATASAGSSHSAAERAYLDALKAIDPGLVAKEDRAVSRGESTCQTIASDNDHAKVVSMTAQRFTGGDVQVDQAKAERIVAAARTHLCPD